MLTSLLWHYLTTKWVISEDLAIQKSRYKMNSNSAAWPNFCLSPLGWLLAGLLPWELAEVAFCAVSPVELLPRPCRSGWAGCLLLAWPVLGCLSHVCCSMVTGSFQLHNRGGPGVESPLSHGSLRKRQSAFPGGDGWAGCSGALQLLSR